MTTTTIDSSCEPFYISIALDTSSLPHISYYDLDTTALKHAYYDTSWHTETVDNAADVGWYSSITIDSSNKIHISYYDDTNDKLKYATNDSGGWVAGSVTNEAPNDVGTHTSIAVNSSRYPSISYYDETNASLEFAYCDAVGSTCDSDDTEWHKMDSNIKSVNSINGNAGTSLRINSSNNGPAISYTYHDNDTGYDNLEYAICSASCNLHASWTTASVDATASVGLYNSLALYNNNYNNPRISYYDSSDGNLKYAYCDSTCSQSASWTKTTLDTTGDVGLYTSIALDPSTNYPKISYYEANDDQLKFIACNNSACSDTAISTVYDFNTNASFFSLALGSSGGATIPYIAYEYYSSDPSDYYLKIATGSAPTSPSISIDSGATYTNSTSATLTLSATGDSEMTESESSDFTGATWETSAATKALTLSSTNGTKTVYAKFRDEVFVESATADASIILDTVAPTISTTFPTTDAYYNSSSWITISGTSTDTTSGIASTTITIQRTSDSKYWDGDSWETGSTTLVTSGSTTDWTYSLGAANLSDGSYTIGITATDNATNAGTSSVSFNYDNTAPVISSVSVSPNPAKAGQTLTITFTSSKTLASNPTVTVAGNSATYSSKTGNNYTYTYLVISSEGTGTKTIAISGTDTVGNTGTAESSVVIVSYQEQAQEDLENGEQFTLKSDLNQESITGQSLTLDFTKLPTKLTQNEKYYMKWKKQSGYPNKNFLSNWKLTTNLNKYKAKKSSQKFKIKVTFKYTKKQLNKYLKKNKSATKSNLIVKYLKTSKSKWQNLTTAFTDAKLIKKTNKFIVQYFTNFPVKTQYFAIGVR